MSATPSSPSPGGKGNDRQDRSWIRTRALRFGALHALHALQLESRKATSHARPRYRVPRLCGRLQRIRYHHRRNKVRAPTFIRTVGCRPYTSKVHHTQQYLPRNSAAAKFRDFSDIIFLTILKARLAQEVVRDIILKKSQNLAGAKF